MHVSRLFRTELGPLAKFWVHSRSRRQRQLIQRHSALSRRPVFDSTRLDLSSNSNVVLSLIALKEALGGWEKAIRLSHFLSIEH